MSFYGIIAISFTFASVVCLEMMSNSLQMANLLQLAYVRSGEVILLDMYQNYLSAANCTAAAAFQSKFSDLTGFSISNVNGMCIIESRYDSAYGFVNQGVGT